ncbi:hypothetical protein ACFX2F_047130 [Malus domestica]
MCNAAIANTGGGLLTIAGEENCCLESEVWIMQRWREDWKERGYEKDDEKRHMRVKKIVDIWMLSVGDGEE